MNIPAALTEQTIQLQVVREQNMDKEELEMVLATAYKVIDEYANMVNNLTKENEYLKSQVKHWKQEQEYAAKNHLDLLMKGAK